MSINNNETDSVEEVECKGLGGWLILLGIGIVFNPPKLIYSTYTIFKRCFSENNWSLITSPSSPNYHALLKSAIIFELVANIIMIILSLGVLFLFFKKSKHFPKAWISTFIFLLITHVIDMVLCKQIPLIGEYELRDLYNTLFRTIGSLAIWFPYLIKSKRVKNTFVE